MKHKARRPRKNCMIFSLFQVKMNTLCFASNTLINAASGLLWAWVFVETRTNPTLSFRFPRHCHSSAPLWKAYSVASISDATVLRGLCHETASGKMKYKLQSELSSGQFTTTKAQLARADVWISDVWHSEACNEVFSVSASAPQMTGKLVRFGRRKG